MTQIKLPDPKPIEQVLTDIKQTKVEKFFNPLFRVFYFIADIPYKIKKIIWFFNRGKNGWAVEDTWSLGAYFYDVIPQSIRYFNEKKHGHPSNVSSFEEWTSILDKIVKGFEAAKAQDNIDVNKFIGADDFSAAYNEKYNELEKIRLEGMNLFVEYFHALWD